MTLPRRCIDGGELIAAGSRCDYHQRLYRARYRGDWPALSRQVITEEHGICWLCDKPGADTADHVIPAARGGSNDRSNLRAAHRSCNSSKGKR